MPLIPFPFIRISLLVSSLFLAACQAVISESGNIIDPAKVEQIHVGTTTHDEVLKLLGPPTLTNTYRQQRWVYIQDRQFKNLQRTFSRVTNRIEITFDANGVVKDVERNFDDTLYDPRNVTEQDKDKGYTKWLFGSEFAKPNNNPKPTESTQESKDSGSLWPSFLSKNKPSEDLKPDTTPDQSADKPEETKSSSWSIWPWNKKDETTKPQPETPAASEEPATHQLSTTLADESDLASSHTRLKAPALLEQLDSMEIKPPKDTPSDGPTPTSETPPKSEESTEKPEPEPSSAKPSWWQFWSK